MLTRHWKDAPDALSSVFLEDRESAGQITGARIGQVMKLGGSRGVFEAFRIIDEQNQQYLGNRLTLSDAKVLVEKHSGKFEVQSV